MFIQPAVARCQDYDLLYPEQIIGTCLSSAVSCVGLVYAWHASCLIKQNVVGELITVAETDFMSPLSTGTGYKCVPRNRVTVSYSLSFWSLSRWNTGPSSFCVKKLIPLPLGVGTRTDAAAAMTAHRPLSSQKSWSIFRLLVPIFLCRLIITGLTLLDLLCVLMKTNFVWNSQYSSRVNVQLVSWYRFCQKINSLLCLPFLPLRISKNTLYCLLSNCGCWRI